MNKKNPNHLVLYYTRNTTKTELDLSIGLPTGTGLTTLEKTSVPPSGSPRAIFDWLHLLTDLDSEITTPLHHANV